MEVPATWPDVTLTWPETVSPELADGVAALVEAAARHDGVEPMSEDVRLRLRPGADVTGRLLVASRPADLGSPVGITYLGITYLGGDYKTRQAELLVHPVYRRRGVGTGLLGALLTAAGSAATTTLAVWAHGDGPAASALAHRFGFARGRVLWQLRRPLGADPPPEPVWPAGVSMRTFEPGRDEPAWLALNRRVFAHHPEQGRWDASDLADREAEAWFDPAGFLLAERDGQLVGFHWTKVHPADPASGESGEKPTGEVYVVGVDPAAAGAGLGKALTLAGLHHLRRQGLRTVMLYVDDDNPSALRLYTSLGFDRHSCDVCYVRELTAPRASGG